MVYAFVQLADGGDPGGRRPKEGVRMGMEVQRQKGFVPHTNVLK